MVKENLISKIVLYLLHSVVTCYTNYLFKMVT